MEFITCLPKSEVHGSSIIVVDMFSKYATFVPAPVDYTVEEAAKHLVKY